MQENPENNMIPISKRPEGLSFICVLSFIGGGLSLFSNFIIYALYNEVLVAIEEGIVMELPSLDLELLTNMLEASGRTYYLLVDVLYAFSVYGVYKMWNLKKQGIHFYAIAQIILIILPLIYIDKSLSVFPGLMVTAAFIFVYSRYYKMMS
jgi:hypothetical protein